MTATKTIVVYKGRKYHLMWNGMTRYGERCKLRFMTGFREFWVDADKVSGLPTSKTATVRNADNGDNCPWESSARVPDDGSRRDYIDAGGKWMDTGTRDNPEPPHHVPEDEGSPDVYEYDCGIPSEYEV